MNHGTRDKGLLAKLATLKRKVQRDKFIFRKAPLASEDIELLPFPTEFARLVRRVYPLAEKE